MSFSSEPVIIVRDADIYQQDIPVISNIKFEIEKGDFVYLIGRTGSGKSSLLKTLYADLPLLVGEINVAGFQINNIPDDKVPFLRRKLGIVFQDFQLFQDRSVFENLLFVLKATGWKDNSKMKQRITEVLMRVGLGYVGSKMPYQLSGGEQQRVVIARSLLNDPVIMIADEPTGNLDPEVAEGIFKIFLDINRSGTTILMATHNHNLIKSNPARILKCEKGNLLDSKVQTFELLSGAY
ncbi:MAG: ATP-binding cassette domain-containing protein [Bacteroidota bacterium]|nr:ATP-binding cassette domain-containing protein [Bacteroidota bacterium]